MIDMHIENCKGFITDFKNIQSQYQFEPDKYYHYEHLIKALQEYVNTKIVLKATYHVSEVLDMVMSDLGSKSGKEWPQKA